MKPLRIGITANFMYPEETHKSYAPKTLLYAEEDLLHWIQNGGAMPILLPPPLANITIDDLLHDLDGLIISGGADICPATYGEKALKKAWEGDRKRDLYEIEVLNAALQRKLPVLGLCRGMQLINVAFGGTMVQDIPTQHPDTQAHKDKELYDRYTHEITIEPGSLLSSLYKGAETGRVNSVHHQAVKDLGDELLVQAYSTDKKIIEALALDREDQYLFAVQWHPEWIKDPALLAPDSIRDHFFDAIRAQQA